MKQRCKPLQSTMRVKCDCVSVSVDEADIDSQLRRGHSNNDDKWSSNTRSVLTCRAVCTFQLPKFFHRCVIEDCRIFSYRQPFVVDKKLRVKYLCWIVFWYFLDVCLAPTLHQSHACLKLFHLHRVDRFHVTHSTSAMSLLMSGWWR